MYQFASDYASNAHPLIREALLTHHDEQTAGYGRDPFCEAARAAIQAQLRGPAGIHFFVGGTQVNTTVIAAALRPHEGVIAAATGHIAVHEAGAIEASGHKVILAEDQDGKITEEGLRACLRSYHEDPTAEHMVKPGLLYLSNTTELGTVYRLEELQALRTICQSYGLPLYLDGARLASAMAYDPSLTLASLHELCDAFTLGGTKAGLYFGEALILQDPSRWPGFRSIQKQRGALLAKGRLLGLQFQAFLEKQLYLEIGRWQNHLAMRLAKGFSEAGARFHAPAMSNQLFLEEEKAVAESLAKDVLFDRLPLREGQELLRFCVSWDSKEHEVDALIAAYRTAKQKAS